MKRENQEAKSETKTVNLRKQAEKIASKTDSLENIEVMSPEERRMLLHELRVHQVELEMQNDELQRTEAELNAQRERYFDLYDLAPVGYMTVSKQGLILEANLTAATLLGVAKSALSKVLLTRFIIKEDQDIYYRHRKELFETHSAGSGQEAKPQTFELRMVKKDETYFWAHLEAIATQEPSASSGQAEGKPVCRIVLNDITERRQAEELLRESHEQLRDAHRLAHIGIWNWVAETDTVTWSEELYSIAGIDPSKPAPTFAEQSNIYTPESWDLLKKAVERAQQTGESYQLELKLIRPDGTTRWVNAFGGATYDGNGRNTGLHGTLQDITDLKQSEESLQESKLLSDRYLNVAAEIIISLDRQANITLLNDNGHKLLGYIPGELIEKNWVETCLPKENKNEVKNVFALLMKGTIDQVKNYENEVITKSGEVKTIAWHNTLLLDDQGMPTGILSSGEDITARKHAEEEKRDLEERLIRAEKMESLGLLAGGVAHDLNNVLGIVVGYAELVLDAVDEKSPLRKDLKTIFDGGQRAAAIVEDLLTLARRGVVGKKALNLNKLIGNFKKSPQWEKLLTYHPLVQIKTDLDPDLLNISASSIHLEKTLYNLVSNAGEAMTSGGNINIKTSNQYIDKPISGYDTIHEGDYVVLSVSDEGDGISETDIKRIFEPFYTKKIMGRSGTGLGLSVVWGTVKDHQGYIDVQSEEGKGTTFILYFLITREDILEEGLAVSMSEYQGNGESILIVDDVKDQRDLAARLLTSLNYQVSSVESGEDAIKYLKDHQPDLIVLDMIMDPGIDGLDTYKSILEIKPKQKAIIVSGFSESDRVKEAKVLGAGAYIKKPYIKEKLGLAVKKELGSKR